MAQNEVTVKTYIEKIDKLIANDLNPRIIDKNKYEELKRSLKEFPQMKQLREIIVDEDMMILAGHQRIYALQDLGYKDVTIKQVFGLTEKQKRRFMIVDNDHSGKWDTDMLANHFEIEELKDWGISSFKLEGDDREKKESKSGGSSEVECPACGHVFDPNGE